MTSDLFLTKEQKFLEWCCHKKVFSKADAMRFGLDNFYIRSERTLRDFVQENKVRKLSGEECFERELKGKMGWYQFNEKP